MSELRYRPRNFTLYVGYGTWRLAILTTWHVNVVGLFAHRVRHGKEYVETDQQLLRPTEIETLTGDYGAAKAELGWEPRTTFTELIQMMVDADLERFR